MSELQKRPVLREHAVREVRTAIGLSTRTEHTELTRTCGRREPDSLVRVRGAVDPAAEGKRVHLCRNYEEYDACNWAVPAEATSTFCRSCALNEVIPNLETPESRQAWARLETAKRRLLYSLSALGLPVEPRSAPGGLAFAFKASTPEEPVFTGHSDGLITINIAEASDPVSREDAGARWASRIVRVLGHFRHEIGTTTGTV